MWSPLLAFAVIAIVFTVGDYVSEKTKGLIASILTADIIFMILGGVLHILPGDLMQISVMAPLTSAIGLALSLTNLGSTFNLDEFQAEWKTVLVSFGGVVGCTVACLTIGALLFGHEVAYSSAAPVAGGVVAGLISTEAANAAGRSDIAAIVSGVVGLQILIGAPIASFSLRKEVLRFIDAKEYEIKTETKQTSVTKKLISLPQFFSNSSTAQLARLALVATLGLVVSQVTPIPAAVTYLVFGTIAGAIGFLDKDGLGISGSKGLITLAFFAMICESFLSVSLADFGKMLVPIFGIIIVGVAGSMVFAYLVGKALKWSPWMSLAVSMCIILGYPSNYVITTEVVKNAIKGMDFNEEQVLNITNHVLRKMLIGSIIAVSISSVIIASYLAPMIFK